MTSYVLLSEKSWHDQLFYDISTIKETKWIRISDKEKFNAEELKKITPRQIFIPHWSYLIPPIIYENYECIVFHMTDLPYGRGGSPLQNLIVHGHEETMISAIRAGKGLDTGPIYLKKQLGLHGTAEEIFIRSSTIIGQMIEEIISKNLEPTEQKGKPVIFERRKPEDGDISVLQNINEIYNYIRMLDAEGYPKAFIDIGRFRLEFSRASLKSGNRIVADVWITEK